MTNTSDNTTRYVDNHDPEYIGKDLEAQTAIDEKYEFCETTPTYIRHDFIKKVFGIVLLQLLFIFSYTLITYNIPKVREFYLKYSLSVHIFASIYIFSTLILSCFPNFCKDKRVSLACLFILTPILAYVLAGYCSVFTSREIAIAIGLTTLTVIILLTIAFQSKYDFTKWLIPVAVVSLNFVLIFIFTITIRSRVKELIFCGIGLVLATLYLIIDVQMIIGGNHRYIFTVDDYMFASLCVTTDIVRIFMDLLRLVRF